jgi:hypothetical protein
MYFLELIFYDIHFSFISHLPIANVFGIVFYKFLTSAQQIKYKYNFYQFGIDNIFKKNHFM